MIGVVVLVVGVGGGVDELVAVAAGVRLEVVPEVDVLEGTFVREADRDAAPDVVADPRGVDAPAVPVVCVTVCEVSEVPAFAGPSAPSDEDLSGRMKANDTSAVSPPIHSRTSDGRGFQVASRPTACR